MKDSIVVVWNWASVCVCGLCVYVFVCSRELGYVYILASV